MSSIRFAALAALALGAAARAQDAAPPAHPPAPPPAAGGDKAVPLTLEQVRVLLVRGEANLRLHAVTFDDEHLRRALADFGRAFAGMPPEAEPAFKFDAAFALAFAIARSPTTTAGEAAEAMKAAVALYPESGPLAIVEGMLEEKAGHFAKAAERIQEGFALLENPATRIDQGRRWQLRLFGLLSLGRAELEPAVGKEHLALQRFLEAQKMAEAAVADPATPAGSRLRIVMLTHLAAAYQHLDYLQEQVDTLDLLIRMDGGNSLHFYNRGLIAAGQNRLEEALRYYRLAIDRDPRNPRPRLKIAYILLVHPKEGAPPDIRGARAEAEAYLSLVGQPNGEYWACRGEAARLEGNSVEAEKWFRLALGADPGCLKALDRLVKILWQKDHRTPSEEEDLLQFKKRLNDRVKQRARGSGMETGRSGDETFCQAPRGAWLHDPACGIARVAPAASPRRPQPIGLEVVTI